MNTRQTASQAAGLAGSATAAALSATPVPSVTEPPQPTMTLTPSPLPTLTPTPSPLPTHAPTETSSPPPFGISLTEADAGKTVVLKTGDTFQVILEGNPSTGFSWILATQEPAIIQQVGEFEYQPYYPNTPGSPGLLTLKFIAFAKGQSVLHLDYKQPWDKGMVSEKTFEVTLIVK